MWENCLNELLELKQMEGDDRGDFPLRNRQVFEGSNRCGLS